VPVISQHIRTTDHFLRAWMVNFFQRKFHVEEGKLGSLFFVTSIIAAASSLVASSLAKRIGNIKVCDIYVWIFIRIDHSLTV